MKWVKRLIILSVLMIGTVALASRAERWLFYPFDSTHVPPAKAGISAMQEIRFQRDKTQLIIWTHPARPGKPVIYYLHGNAGNLATRAGRFRHFIKQGYGVVAPAYRGSSGSQGTPNQKTLAADARALFVTLRRTPEKLGQRAGPVVLYGESIGAAVGIHFMDGLARRAPAIELPQAVVLEAPFASIAAMAETHYPSLTGVVHKLENKWDSLARARVLKMPLLILHGPRDALVPIEQGRQVFTAAPSKHKQFLQVTGAGHTDLWRSDSLPKLWRFIARYAVNSR